MTDNEIIKALRCCNDIRWCNHCPLYKVDFCKDKLSDAAIDLFDRQKTEFEEQCKTAKAEAIKEFAERLKKGLQALLDRDMETYYVGAEIEQIDNIVKEMVGDNDEIKR